jgi:dinuclear metal center YbgI/SA1388 family protein
MKLPISDRLLCCASFLYGKRVADVGCDHGYLGIHLLENHIAESVIAADINEGPLQSAMRNAEKYGVADKMTFHLSDGAKNIPRDFDALVCAGMGADTMIHILEEAPWLRSKQYYLVLQCQSKTPMLRRYLSNTGWRIVEESIVKDGKFLYTVMAVVWQPEHAGLTAGECYITPAMLNSINHDLPEYYRAITDGLRLAVEHQDNAEKKQVLAELETNPALKWVRAAAANVTVGDVLDFVESIAPRSMKMDWDNVGLLCGSRDTLVSRILVALDPFEHVCQEAADWGAELIVTHHPIIFQALKSITDETSVGRGIRTLIRHDISAINAHTNLDQAPGGVNDVLAQTLGLADIQVINESGVDEEGRAWGLLRCGEVAQQPLEAFLGHVKAQLGCDGLRFVDGGKPVCKVAVGGGACAGELRAAVRAGCDTFVTSDVKYNQFWDAKDQGVNLIDAGHFHTENPVVAALAEKLQAVFPDLEVKISEKHNDCMKFY